MTFYFRWFLRRFTHTAGRPSLLWLVRGQTKWGGPFFSRQPNSRCFPLAPHILWRFRSAGFCEQTFCSCGKVMPVSPVCMLSRFSDSMKTRVFHIFGNHSFTVVIPPCPMTNIAWRLSNLQFVSSWAKKVFRMGKPCASYPTVGFEPLHRVTLIAGMVSMTQQVLSISHYSYQKLLSISQSYFVTIIYLRSVEFHFVC